MVHFYPKNEENSVLFDEFIWVKRCCLMRFINHTSIFYFVYMLEHQHLVLPIFLGTKSI